MRFFDRESELERLADIERRIRLNAQFTVLTGRMRVGSWWDRKGENEIDMIAENEVERTYVVCEVKRDKSRIDIGLLKEKFAAFTKATGHWKRADPQFLTLGMEDM